MSIRPERLLGASEVPASSDLLGEFIVEPVRKDGAAARVGGDDAWRAADATMDAEKRLRAAA